MSRIGKSKTPEKKRTLPPSRTQFAWAMEQRANAKSYFHSRLEEWDTLGTTRAKIEAAEALAAELAAVEAAAAKANPQQPAPASKSSVYTPTPNRRTVRPPAHLVFRTKIVTRTPKPK